MQVAISGASGLVGQSLVRRLQASGDSVLRLVRRDARAADELRWDPRRGEIDANALAAADAVVNLAGENIGERWTPERLRRMRDSRVEGTRLLAETMAGLERGPRVLVNASAVGLYGDRGDTVLDEEAGPGGGILAGLVRDWEAATEPAAGAGVRVVLLRFGVVLSARGGALAKMLTPFRLGAGGPLGSGQQWMSWIGLEDAVEVLHAAVHDERMRGPVNAVAGAVRNAEFTSTLGAVLQRPALIPVPAFALKLAFGTMAEETILFSQRAEPRALQALGWRFRHPALRDALAVAVRDQG